MASSQSADGPGTPTRRSRRSWFDAPPLTTLDPPPPTQKPEVRDGVPKRRSIDTVETLTLTHFTNPPRLAFGKILVGKTKYRTLLIRNPHDYEQEVIIERFPYKKKFMVDHTRFTVAPEEVFTLQITWTPEEAGGFREMIQFHINDVYRLQAFLIGNVEKPKPPRRVRKHPLGPRVRQPPTIVQTPALTSIKASYSPRRSQEARELLEDLTRQQHGEDKENQGGSRNESGSSGTMILPKGGVVNSNKDNKWTEDITQVLAPSQVKGVKRANPEEEATRSPTPLESTTISGKPESHGSQKNRPQWRNISDITSPSLNMSPIPVCEGNENGITVDSYFQPNETGTASVNKTWKSAGESGKSKGNERHVSNQLSSAAFKETFVMPAPPLNPSNFTKLKRKELEATEHRTTIMAEENSVSCSSGQPHRQSLGRNEVGIIRQNETHIVKSSNAEDSQRSVTSAQQAAVPDINQMEMRQRQDWTSPKTDDNGESVRTSPVSPRTMLDESLTLISQMKVPTRSTDMSPQDGDASINASLISQGQGLVSPNSFLEDMKSLLQDSRNSGNHSGKNTSTPNAPSPSAVLNNSIPHDIMVNHLKNVRSSLHESPHAVALRSSLEGKTPKKPPSSRFATKRRSITSQFQKNEVKRIAAAAKAVQEDKLTFSKKRQVKVLPKKDQELISKKLAVKKLNQKGNLPASRSGVSPNHDPSGSKQKNTQARRASFKKKSPVVKRSPRSRGSPRKSTQDIAMKRVKGRLNKANSSAKSTHTNSNGEVSDKVLTHLKESSTTDQKRETMIDAIDDQTSSSMNVEKSSMATPKKEQHSFDSGTVVKCRSMEDTHENNSKFFDGIFPDEEGQKDSDSQRNSSMTKRGKLFPDLQVADSCETQEVCQGAGVPETASKVLACKSDVGRKPVDADVNCQNNDDEYTEVCKEVASVTPTVVVWRNEFSKNGCSGSEEIRYENRRDEATPNHTTEATPRKSRMDRVIGAAERSMSPQRFYPLSPSNLPTSPSAGLEPSRRGTLTITKSRPSDALLTAMNNRKKLFQESAQPPSFLIQEDDSETQENIRVRVEERYQEIDGKMYLVVKETTDVVKSTTETYIEHMDASPQQFKTPTRLPTSPDPQMSRRSTHVVRSPKVIDVASMNKKRLDFLGEAVLENMEDGDDQMDANGKEAIRQNRDQHDDAPTGVSAQGQSTVPELETTEASDFKTRSDTFEKESTILATPDRLGLNVSPFARSIAGSEPPITAVCAMSPKLVDYDDIVSESGGSGDVTRDSLDTNQSKDSLDVSEHDSLNKSGGVDRVYEKENENQQNNDMDGKKAAFHSNLTESLQKNGLSAGGEINSEDADLTCEAAIVCEATQTIGKSSTVPDDESEEEKFYDTMSERYYDALSDTLNADVEEEPEEIEVVIPNDLCDNDLFANLHTKETAECTMVAETQKEADIGLALPSKGQSAILERNLTQSESLQPEGMFIEREIDHIEAFEIIEKDVFEVCRIEDPEPEPVEDEVCKTSETKASKKLRRSMSADILLPTTFCIDKSDEKKQSVEINTTQPSLDHTKAKTLMKQSKSEVFAKPATQVSKKIAQTRTSKGQLPLAQNELQKLKQRSQSLTNLPKQANKTSSRKTSADAVDAQKSARQVSQVSHSASRSKKAVKGVAQSRLILVKKPKTGAPRHPMPFAARNMYYDERWMEKQERGFVQWLNFVLTPPDEYVAVTTKVKVDAGSLSLDTHHVTPRLAPTKEILSFRAYAARRRLNRLRRAACELYQSEPIVNIICKIETEVESRRIAVRKDKMVHADLGIKQRLLDLLLHYNSLWLRVGLETVFGEVLMLQSNQDVVGLSRFIVTRLLASPDIAAEFSHPTVPHLYKDGYAAATSRHTVKKFLLLVYFLDQAKSSRLIDHDPCLFCKDAEIKTSKEILVRFSQEVLSGEGDITRHLAYLGYNVSQAQKPIDEFDYAVATLSSDLRDGLRLSRVLELLANNHTIMRKLRAPAISRLQKIHNTEVFFKAMVERGLNFNTASGPITARDVVDGHREKTLSLLWHLIIHFQSCIQVNEEQLKEEIDMLIKSLQLKVAMQKISALAVEECPARRDSGETKLLMDNQRLQLIFQWCRLVCLHYGVKVENFTVSFSDGRALCCLLHHYHPALLPLSEIQFRTTISFQEDAEDRCPVETDPDLSVDWGAGGGLMPDEDNPEIYERLLANEKANFKTLYEKVSALGGVPLMLRFADMSNTIPDEKVVSTYVSYLCARLLDIREEVRAARLIQMAWRRKQLQRAVRERQRKTKAAITIQHWIRPYLTRRHAAKQEAAAISIQAAWRRCLAREQVMRLKQKVQDEERRTREEKAAITMQNLWRSRSARHQLNKLREEKKEEEIRGKEEAAAVTIQKYVRGLKCRQEYLKQKASAVKIQASWRGHRTKRTLKVMKHRCIERSAILIQKCMKRQICQTRFKRQKEAAVVLQRTWRMRKARQNLQMLRAERQANAAVIIQKRIRGHLGQRKFQEMKRAALILQGWWKVRQARRKGHALRCERKNNAAILVQHFMKSAICRRNFLMQKTAAVNLQKHWRRNLAQRQLAALKLQRDNRAAVVLQKHFRGWKTRQEFFALRKAAVVLQNAWKMVQAKNELKMLRLSHQEKSAMIIQQFYKGFKCRRQFVKCRAAAIRIQNKWRMHQAKKELARLHLEHQMRAAVIIQKNYRGFRIRRSIAKQRTAATVIQNNWRMYAAEKELQNLKHQRQDVAALVIQKNLKSLKCCREFVRLKAAAVVMQKTWRMVQAQKVLIKLREQKREKSAVLLQKMWRGYKAQQSFVEKRRAAVTLQSYWRMFRTWQYFCRLKEATVIIQTWHRANMMAREQRSVYIRQRKSAICIQTWWRCRLQRQKFLRMKHAAIVIQANFRCFRRQLKYLAVKLATIIIQQGYKNYVRGRKVRQEYLAIRSAVITIQRSFRRYLERKHLHQEASALVLQTAFRKFSARRKYLAQKQAVEIIQRRLREYQKSKSARHEFLRQKHAINVIQSAYRSFKMKQQYKHVCHSIVKIQAFVRCRLAVKRYKTIRDAVCVIQRWYRATKQGLLLRQSFLLSRKSAVTIQRFYRAVQARRKVQREIASQNAAAMKIQAVYRGWSQRQDYLLLRAATVSCQRRCRALQTGRAVRADLKRMGEAAGIVQRRWRCYKEIQEAKREVERRRDEIQKERERKLEEERLMQARREEEERIEMERKVESMRREKAAVVMQRCLRAYLIMKDYARRENAAVTIQKCFRGYQARLKYKREMQHVLFLQRLIQGFACRRNFERMRLAATIIQRRWREIREGKQQRAEFLANRHATIKIQTQIRMKLEQVKYQQVLRKVTALQAGIRMHIQRQRYLEMKRQVLNIQRRVRSHQRMRRDRESFLRLRRSAIKIQSIVRLWLAYRHIQCEKSVIKIQAQWKMCQQQSAFSMNYETVQTLRSFVEIKNQQVERQRREAAAQCIQQTFRRYLQRQEDIKNSAACVIQRTFRKYLLRHNKERNTAAFIIQRTMRRFVIQRRVIKSQSAVTIQALARQFLERRRYLSARKSVVLLQAAVRGWHARRAAKCLRARQQALICLQAHIRGFLARKKLMPILKERLEVLKEKRRQHRASTIIQATWRGFVTRRDSKNKKLTQARKRLEKANRSATEERTLGSRTSSALDYLLRERDLAAILEALMHLEVATRLSPVCCERMVEVNAVSVLYQLMSSCNRSVPHMELIKYSVNILLNLAKYEKTVAAVMEPQESVSTIAELLQIYREKGAIFLKCCMLLGILGIHPGRRERILAHPHIIDRLQSIHALTLRKQRTSQNRQVTQAKMAAMKNFNCTLPVLTPTKSKRRRVRPEWVLARDNIKDFDDPLTAVTFVMDVLQIGPKM